MSNEDCRRISGRFGRMSFALATVLLIVPPGAKAANPAIAAAGCVFPNGTKAFYFPNLWFTPAIGSKFVAMVAQPTMAVNCQGGSALRNSPAYTITVSQVSEYKDVGGGHYFTIAGQ